MEVLLSIKPEFANKIFNGDKKYEYRKVIFKNRDVNKIVVYASAPTSKVIGEFEIEKIMNESPEVLWQKTKRYSGISRIYFEKYFKGRSVGYAIKVKKVKKYKTPKSLQDEYGLRPPQSFIYLSKVKHTNKIN